MAWRWWATRLNGDGTETLIASGLPLGGQQVVKTLSGADTIRAKLAPEHPSLQATDGRPILLPWSTAIYGETGGAIRAGGIVTSLASSGHELAVEAAGFSTYLDGLPWTNTTRKYYDADPAKVARDLWAFAQMHPNGNIGVTLSPDNLTTPVRVGVRTPERKDSKGEVVEQATDEPVLLARWETSNLADVWHEMCEAGSIDYVEEHEAQDDGTIAHRLRLGYPRLGKRRTDLGFVIGVNTTTIPDVDLHVDDYASEVLVLAAGEGEKMLTAHARNDTPGRLRRVRVVQEKGIGRQATANRAAETHLKRWSGTGIDVSTIQVIDHPLAPLWGFDLGDEIRLTGDAWWGGRLDMWVRVLEVTYGEADHLATVTVARAGVT